MKQFNKDDYLALLRLWDKKHHLIGKTSPELLYAESVEALGSLPKGLLSSGCFDLGAGNGILGVPALLEGFAGRVYFVEPLPKPVAFLEAFKLEMRLAGDSRWKNIVVLPAAVQDVSRETLEQLVGANFGTLPVLSRAFSGPIEYLDALGQSELCRNRNFRFFVDEQAQKKVFMLREVVDRG